MVAVAFFIGICIGVLVGLMFTFDWQAYFKYKKEIVELGMKYEKEVGKLND